MADQKPNDRKVSFKKYPTKFNLDTTVKPKRTPNEESKKKLKALGFATDGSVVVCFLCGKTNSHYAYLCRTYRNETCTDVQCARFGFYHDKSKCKHQNQGRVVSN